MKKLTKDLVVLFILRNPGIRLTNFTKSLPWLNLLKIWHHHVV